MDTKLASTDNTSKSDNASNVPTVPTNDDPSSKTKQTFWAWLKKRNQLIERQKLLKTEITDALIENPNAQIQKKLIQLGELEQIIEIQSKKSNVFINLTLFSILSVLILSGIPGLPTPGYVDVKTKVVEFILTEDYEWSGIINVQQQSSLQLSNFEQIYSPNIPELNIQEKNQVLLIKAQKKAILESLSIPAGSKVIVEWQDSKNSFALSVSPSDTFINQDLIVRAEYLLTGATSFMSEGLQGAINISRASISCEFEDDCLASRSLIVSSPLHSNPKFRINTTDEVDLYGFEVSQFWFSKLTAQSSLRRRNRCMILSGEYWLRGADNSTQLRRGECIKVASKGGALSIQVANASNVSSNMNVWYQGEIDKLRVGTPEFSIEKSPQIFAWLVSHPNIKITISILSALLAAGLIVRIKK